MVYVGLYVNNNATHTKKSENQFDPVIIFFRIYEQHRHISSSSGGAHLQPSIHPHSGVMFRKDIFYGGSLYNIPEYK